MVQRGPAELPPTSRRRERAARERNLRPLNLAMTLLLLAPPLILALWGGFEILRHAHAVWQWPWGVFFIAVALCPLLIAIGRRGVRESDAPSERH